jgi:predicted ATP-dependent endonuclease of OLD family
MKLKAVRITNYKCIEDSTEFSVGPVTCLVGKNESGKTALLDALYRLNPYYSEDRGFDKIGEYPRRYLLEYSDRHKQGEAKVVETRWELDADDVSKVEKLLGAGCLLSTDITVSKHYSDTSQIWNVPLDESKVIGNLINVGSLHSEEADAARKNMTVAQLKKYLDSKGNEISTREKKALDKIGGFRDSSCHKAAIDVLTLPKFLYFGDYDLMSGNVALEDMLKRKENLKASEKVFLAFLAMVGTSLEEINSIDKFEPLKARLEAASNKITREIFEYWTQNRHLRVQFTLDAAQAGDVAPFNAGKILHTRIYNMHHDVSVSFDERSRGFVWFFSFLVLFSQVKKTHGDNVVILLDEPGVSLHAKAQADLLRYIDEKLRPFHQVLYTSHSPFMIPPEDLLSARTVEDVVSEQDGKLQILGTKVGDRVLSTDKDTLFPLQSALGYEITQSLFVGEHTLLVEGPSDYLYLKVFSDELKSRGRTCLDPRWVICPTGGIDKVSAFMSLFGGNKIHVAILVDLAKGQKKRVDELRRSKLLRDGHVFSADSYAGQEEADTEDLIGRTAFMALVNQTYGLSPASQLNPATGTTQSGRVLKDVEQHFALLPPNLPEFDHFRPAAYLLENRSEILAKLPSLESGLERFENLFSDLNKLLSVEARNTAKAAGA